MLDPAVQTCVAGGLAVVCVGTVAARFFNSDDTAPPNVLTQNAPAPAADEPAPAVLLVVGQKAVYIPTEMPTVTNNSKKIKISFYSNKRCRC